MRQRIAITELLSFLWRFICATIVTFAVLTVVVLFQVTMLDIGLRTFLSGAVLIGVTSQCIFGSPSIAYISGLAGIYVGSMCLRRSSRGLACVALTVMVVMFYQTFWYADWRYMVNSKHGNGSLALPLAAGGLTAFVVVVGSRKWSKGAETNSDASRAGAESQ